MKTLDTFLEEFKNVKTKHQNLDKSKKYSITLCRYLNELTKYDFERKNNYNVLKEMCNKIVENFSNNNSLKKYSNIKRMTIILENKLKAKKLYSFLVLKFKKMNQISYEIEKSGRARSKPKSKNYDFNDVKLTSTERKEIAELKECSFVPKIITTPSSSRIRSFIKEDSRLSNSQSFIKDQNRSLSKRTGRQDFIQVVDQNQSQLEKKSSKNVFGRLYQDVECRNEKKLNQTMERSLEISKELTFTPEMITKKCKPSRNSLEKSKSFSNIEIEKVYYK